MGTNLRKKTVAALLAGSAAVLMAPPAGANRGNATTTTTEPAYVPSYGQNPHPELPDEPNPYANPLDNPVGGPTIVPVAGPTIVPVDLPAKPRPKVGEAGGGDDRVGPAPSDAPRVPDGSGTRPENAADDGGFIDGILSRTGAETLPLARAGLAVLALGVGLVVLARRGRRSLPPEPIRPI